MISPSGIPEDAFQCTVWLLSYVYSHSRDPSDLPKRQILYDLLVSTRGQVTTLIDTSCVVKLGFS